MSHVINPVTGRKILINGPTFRCLPNTIEHSLIGHHIGGGPPTKHYPKDISNQNLSDTFVKNCEEFGKVYNDTNVKKSADMFRIITFNVHMWEGVIGHETSWSDTINAHNNFTNIWSIITRIDPDVLCLQEVMFNEQLMKPLLDVYEIVSSCNINPSNISNRLYMTIILIKKEVKSLLYGYYPKAGNDAEVSVPVPEKHFIGRCVSQQSCYLGSYAETFVHDPELWETKCFAVMRLPALRIINTHLTAYDKNGTRRLKEINTIHEYIERNNKNALNYNFIQSSKGNEGFIPTVILGDFNMINRSEYTSVEGMQEHISKLENKYGLTDVEYKLAANKWKDLYFRKNNKFFVNFSNWTNFRVDHIFGHNFIDHAVDKISIKPYFTSVSDHIPLIIDMPFHMIMRGYGRDQLKIQLLPDEKTLSKIIDPNKSPFQKVLSENTQPMKILDPFFLQIPESPILLFNAQPIMACNWFNYGHTKTHGGYVVVNNKNDFLDPYFAGTNSYESLLGVSGGIYVANNHDYCSTIIQRIFLALSELNDTTIKTNMYLQFIFSLDYTKSTNIDVNYTEFINNQNKFYQQNDLIVCSKKSSNVGLVTQKGLSPITVGDSTCYIHRYLKLKYVVLIVNEENMTIGECDKQFNEELNKWKIKPPTEFHFNQNKTVECDKYEGPTRKYPILWECCT